jgi:hypothetical protein
MQKPVTELYLVYDACVVTCRDETENSCCWLAAVSLRRLAVVAYHAGARVQVPSARMNGSSPYRVPSINSAPVPLIARLRRAAPSPPAIRRLPMEHSHEILYSFAGDSVSERSLGSYR